MSRDSVVHVGASGGVYVDVGEKDLFYVELEDTTQYTIVYAAMNRVVLRAVSTDGHSTAMRIVWSAHKRVAQNRGYRGMQICEGMNCVPTLYTRDLHIIGSTFVEVTTRDYIEGQPLADVWCDMDDTERINVAMQVEEFAEAVSRMVHDNFMALQGRNLSTHDPVAYLNYKIILSMITRDLRSGDCSVLDMEPFHLAPVLCHGNLCMEHIIVKGCAVTGIVGWSKCDFVPEVMDRMGYHFSKPRAEGEGWWYSRLAATLLFHPAPPPLYTIACARYTYYLRIGSTPLEYHDRLKSKLDEAYGTLMPFARQSLESLYDSFDKQRSDQRSQSQHLAQEAPRLSDPFGTERSDTCSVASSEASTVSDFKGWSDNSTVLDILDALSVT